MSAEASITKSIIDSIRPWPRLLQLSIPLCPGLIQRLENRLSWDATVLRAPAVSVGDPIRHGRNVRQLPQLAPQVLGERHVVSGCAGSQLLVRRVVQVADLHVLGHRSRLATMHALCVQFARNRGSEAGPLREVE